jgi:dihydroorotase
MKFILREAKNHRCKSPFHNKTVDILVVDGFIKDSCFPPIQMKPKK